MTSDSSPRPDVCRQLGVLAMRFRRTRDEAARRAIATEYAQEVQRLIETGDWSVAPAFEDRPEDQGQPVAQWLRHRCNRHGCRLVREVPCQVPDDLLSPQAATPNRRFDGSVVIACTGGGQKRNDKMNGKVLTEWR